MQSTTIHYSLPQPAKPRPVPVRHRRTLGELLRRASASVDRGPVKLIQGQFRPVKRGRALTRLERGLILAMAVGLSLAVWLHARPMPVSAHTNYYQSLAFSSRREAATPRAYAESALRTIGSEWKPAVFFASVHPEFWHSGSAVHPNVLVQRIEDGLARLAGHGPVLSVTTFNIPAPVDFETINGVAMLTCQVTGQLELADGLVVRFTARVAQDESSRQWSIINLSVPSFVP